MKNATKTASVKYVIDQFLMNMKRSSPTLHTFKNYRSNLLGESGFLRSLKGSLSPLSPIDQLSERHGVQFLQSMLDRGTSAATRQRAASCLRSFYAFAAYEYELPLNIAKFSYALRIKKLLSGVSDIEYQGEKIQRILDFSLTFRPETLEDWRDLAFLWLLAETGLRVSEAVSLKVGQIDRNWHISFIGKGSKSAVLKLGKHSRKYIQVYLRARSTLDTESGRIRSHLPLFARHDKNAGKGQIKPISQKRAEKIIHNWALLSLGDEYDHKITCHKFRHYCITTIYKLHGDMFEAQKYARHEDIKTTQRYTHRNEIETIKSSEEAFG